MTLRSESCERIVDEIIDQVGTDLTVATPLGLGKPVQLLNGLYRRARENPDLDLTFLTALSLIRPEAEGELRRRLVDPLFDRIFGDYPELLYARDLEKGELPPNVQVKQFYFKAGSQLSNVHSQQNHINTNYTYAVRDIFNQGANVLCQLITPARSVQSRSSSVHSLSCNADLTLDLLDRLDEASGREYRLVGQVNENLPYMYGDCMIETGRFDALLEGESLQHTLFGPPSEPVTDVDHAIGLHASRLVKDGGTLQIGIGSLGDAITEMLILRDSENEAYRKVADAFPYDSGDRETLENVGGKGPFEDGLYASTEMFVRGFEELMRAGILTREVYDELEIQRYVNERDGDSSVEFSLVDRLLDHHVIEERIGRDGFELLKNYGILHEDVDLRGDRFRLPDGRSVPADFSREETRTAVRETGLGDSLENGNVAHASFFLGPTSMYDFLRELDEEDRRKIKMERISFVNDLIGRQELKEEQRSTARFINTAMKVTLSGAVVSDALENMKVVSGVGGQYNFVSMAHDLPDSRSVIMVPSTRESDGDIESNVVWNYGHTTIPRHQRDIVVTEYGIADLRGLTDRDVVEEMLSVTDARFQDELVEKAKSSDKLPPEWEIPDSYRRNRPENLREWATEARTVVDLPEFPFGSELTEVELELARSLEDFREKATSFSFSPEDLTALKPAFFVPESADPYLERMNLKDPDSWQEWYLRKVVLVALEMHGIL